MNPNRIVLAFAAGACAAWLAAPTSAAPPVPLRLVRTLALPGVEGRIDHLVLDGSGRRLFVVALGNNTLEVLDPVAGRRVRTLTGFHEPQGAGLAGSPPRLFVANGGDGSVAVLDAGSFRVVRTVPLGDDADNVRVDGAGGRVYVGFGDGALAALDAGTGEPRQRVGLPSHPEAFQLAGGGSRVFVNLPASGEVAVVDRASGRVTARWRPGTGRDNFPMALDDTGERVFVGCRRPPQVVALDAATGRPLGSVAIDADVDDLFFDGRTGRLVASCGAGFVDVLEAPAAGPLRLAARIPTAAGARTSLLDAARRRLYVAVPHRGSQAAEVRVYELAP